MTKKIAIQGGPASFHDIASRNYYEEKVDLEYCKTFREVCEKVISGEVDQGLMVIENSIAGSILPNYSLIKEYGLFIAGEYKLRIVQNLMALPGQQISDIKLAKSHYMALLQCKEYFERHPHIVLEENHDTADSAKEIRENHEMGVAAIAGDLAAEIYNLEILSESIETNKLNFTRFWAVQKERFLSATNNKATLSFELPNTVGALAEALKIIVDHGINLTKIQSIPLLGKPDQYTFYIDCIWSNQEQIKACYGQLYHLLTNLKVLGEYKNWEINYDHITGK